MEIVITINVVDDGEVSIPYIAKWMTEDMLDDDRFNSIVIEGKGETIQIVHKRD